MRGRWIEGLDWEEGRLGLGLDRIRRLEPVGVALGTCVGQSPLRLYRGKVWKMYGAWISTLYVPLLV